MKNVATMPDMSLAGRTWPPESTSTYQLMDDQSQRRRASKAAVRPDPSLGAQKQKCGWLRDRVPILRWLPAYNFGEKLKTDVTGGITIGMMCLAQTLAHAAIATTKPIQGPYSAFVPALAYAIMGTSCQAAVSSGAIVSILIADQLKWIQDVDDRTEMASLLALLSGAILILMGVCRLAFAARFLSQPTINGFVSGGGILIITSQMKNLCGLRSFPHTDGFVGMVQMLAVRIPLDAEMSSVYLGCGLMVFLEALGRLKKKAVKELQKAIKNAIPNDEEAAIGEQTSDIKSAQRDVDFWKRVKSLAEMKEIFATLAGIIVCYFSAPIGEDGTRNAAETAVLSVGFIPAGLPPFRPAWQFTNTTLFEELVNDPHRFSNFLTGGVLVAFTSFLTTFATSKKMAMKNSYQIDAGQEMIALGSAGLCGSFFGAFTPSGSMSRTVLAEECGVKSQLGGVFSALVVGLGLKFLTPMFAFLPKAALAAIIMTSARNLIAIDSFWKLYASWKPMKEGGLTRDLIVWVLAFVLTLFRGVLYGIGAAVFVSIACIVADAAAPDCHELGKVEGQRMFRNKDACAEAKTEPGILVFEVRGPLCFASAEWFQEQLEEKRRRSTEANGKVSIIILVLTSVHWLDASALTVLEDVLRHLRKEDIEVMISGARAQTRVLIEENFGRNSVKKAKEGEKPERPLLDQTAFLITTSDAYDIAQAKLLAQTQAAVLRVASLDCKLTSVRRLTSERVPSSRPASTTSEAYASKKRTPWQD